MGESRLDAMLIYSYGISEYRRKSEKNWKPFNFDRKHGLAFWGSMRLSDAVRCNVLYRYSSGLPFYDVIGYVDQAGPGGTFVKDMDRPDRFPAYQRLDVRLNYEHHSGNRSFAIYLDVTNLLNQKNIYDQVWYMKGSYTDEGEPGDREITSRSLFMLPFVPSFGLSFSF